MGSKTISLEDSAYALLKAAKREGESFSDVIRRVLGGKRLTILDFEGLLEPKAADEVAAAIADFKKADIETQRRRRR